MEGLYRQLRQRYLVWRARRRSMQASPRSSHDSDVDSEVGNEREHARAIAAHAQAMLDSALDSVIVLDADGKVVEWNAAAERTFRYTRARAIGQQMAELIIPEGLRQKHCEGLAHYLRTGEGNILGRRIEVLARRADGREFPVELTVVRIGTGGKPLFTGFVRDLSERKQAEEALKISEARLRLLAESSTDIVYRFRLQPAPGFEYVSPPDQPRVGADAVWPCVVPPETGDARGSVRDAQGGVRQRRSDARVVCASLGRGAPICPRAVDARRSTFGGRRRGLRSPRASSGEDRIRPPCWP
jgi:PAS domain S-box-containing protein